MSQQLNTGVPATSNPPVQIQESDEQSVYVLYQPQNTGPWKYFVVNGPAKAIISEIKNNLASEWSVPPQCQRLFLNTTELSDDKRSIGSYLSPKDIYVTMTPTDDYTPPVEDDKEPPQTQQTYGGLVYGPSYITNDISGSFRRRMANSDDSDNEWDFFERRPSHGLVGLKNQGATCYLNSLIQVMYMTPEFRKMIFNFERPWDQLLVSKDKDSEKKAEGRQVATTSKDAKPAEKSDKSKDIILQMQLLFARMQFSPVGAVSTSGLTTSFGWDNSEVFVQHDVQELNRVLCDKLEEKMKDKLKPTDYSITKLYKGSMLNMVKCTNCGRISTREEDFYDMSLPIKGKKSILDSLEEFVAVEVMKEDNAYFCEKCQSKQTAEKSVRFKNYPPLINIQLKRFEYDWERDMRVKIHDEIAFPNILDMGGYLVDESLRDKKEKDKDSKPNNNNAIQEDDSPYYELFGVAIHSGNAGFGHYYAFIKNFSDGAWYKFNDEHVTPADEADIFGGSEKQSTSFSWVHSAMMQRSATPYMLVYRRRAVKEIKETKPILEEFKLPPVADTEIPSPIINYLSELQKRKEKKKVEREKERNSANITVFRNRLELPVKYIKVDRSVTLKHLKDEVLKLVQGETTSPTFYRFRRIANRKNNTKRPMNLYKDEDMEKTLGDLMLDKKQMIYLEQDSDSSFSNLDDKGEDEAFVSFRVWSPAHRKPTSLRDFWIPKSWTLTQLKGFLEKETNIPANNMVLIEEETEKQCNLMLIEDQLISKYGIISGDIVHVEQATPEHRGDPSKPDKITTSFTEQYYTEKHNELVVEFEETEKSFKRRTAKDKKEAQQQQQAPVIADDKKEPSTTAPPTTTTTVPEKEEKEADKKDEKKDWKTNKISFKLATNKNHSLKQLKDVVSIKTGIEARKLRLYAKDSYHDGRMLKDLTGKLGKLLLRFSSKLTTELGIEILDHPEDLMKGDKLIQTRYHNASGDFVCFFEVKVNKAETIRNFKEKLTNLTGVIPEAQVVSEWYSERFYKLFQNDQETIQQARIRKMDILRMDQLKESKLNISENNAPFQLVQFIAWESTPFGRKEMQTSFPILLTVPESGTLFDLRKAVAEKVNLPYRNINVAFTSSFPILEGRISPIRDICKAHAPPELVAEIPTPAPKPDDQPVTTTPTTTTTPTPTTATATTPMEEDEDEDARENRLAEQENRDKRVFNFKAEKATPIKKAKFSPLDVICWEDLRVKVEKTDPHHAPAMRNKKVSGGGGRDAEVLKIKN